MKTRSQRSLRRLIRDLNHATLVLNAISIQQYSWATVANVRKHIQPIFYVKIGRRQPLVIRPYYSDYALMWVAPNFTPSNVALHLDVRLSGEPELRNTIEAFVSGLPSQMSAMLDDETLKSVSERVILKIQEVEHSTRQSTTKAAIEQIRQALKEDATKGLGISEAELIDIWMGIQVEIIHQA